MLPGLVLVFAWIAVVWGHGDEGRRKSSASPITISSNWGETDCSAATHCTATSATKTLTVPAGNSGTVKFLVSSAGLASNDQYSKNGGGFTQAVDNSTVVFANGDSLAFQSVSIPPGPSETDYTIVDNDTGTTIGTVILKNTHL
jgi:hypothetical protein